MNKNRIIFWVVFGLLSLGLVVAKRTGVAGHVFRKMTGGRSVAQRLEEFGPAARGRWKESFQRAAVVYPPSSVVLMADKSASRLTVYAANDGGKQSHIRTLPIQRLSGGPGPKLREGDLQVPEGIYEIESLNPNSRFHVSLRVGYPNVFDRAKAALDGRTQLSGDIMIHGKDVSIGCLAMGDEGAEDLFTLAADVGLANVSVLIVPHDFRLPEQPAVPASVPTWTTELYSQLRLRLAELPQPVSQ